MLRHCARPWQGCMATKVLNRYATATACCMEPGLTRAVNMHLYQVTAAVAVLQVLQIHKPQDSNRLHT